MILHFCKNYLLFCAQLDDGRFIKALLSASFNPSTPKHFLGLKLETFLGTLEPACLNGRNPCHLLRKFINVSWQENYTVHLTLTNLFMTVRMYQVPWFPLTLKVEYLALVNNSPYWLLIQWFLSMFDINKFIHIGRIAQGKDVDEDLAVLWSWIILSDCSLHFWIQSSLLFFYRNPVTFCTVNNILEEIFSVL